MKYVNSLEIGKQVIWDKWWKVVKRRITELKKQFIGGK